MRLAVRATTMSRAEGTHWGFQPSLSSGGGFDFLSTATLDDEAGLVNPVDAYQLALQRAELVADAAQAAFVGQLQDLYRRLLQRGERAPRGGWVGRLRQLIGTREAMTPITGIYVWGGVGRGKTLLVDFFFNALPFDRKLRVHFHAFMQRIHHELKDLGERRDPLRAVADRLAQEADVICFDEFHVSDIADAMLLGRLLNALFERGITLVATSNIAPDDLYHDGLQRAQFLPAIELIKRHTQIIHLRSETDYRLRTLSQASVYHQPLDEAARRAMLHCFQQLAPETPPRAGSIEILGRKLNTRAQAMGVAWFDFDVLCDSPRSASDYLEVARRFHTVLLSTVPILTDDSNDAALRFIHLVDTFYDRNVNLVLSADSAPATLYNGRRLAARFERTKSRLQEMQSQEYLARAHLP